MSLSQGSRLGSYEILARIGAGGMGEVYRAKDTRLDRLVAIKVLPDHLAQNPDALARFEREAKAVAALNHPNILGIHEFATQGETAYVVMELLEGESLRARLDQGPLPPRPATELAVQMAQGLAEAHEKGVVHRDLKPDNLWITRDGRLKILDFGLAKVVAGKGSDPLLPTESILPGHQTERGMILGTLGYMSPEQVRGEAVDGRSDLFSFGAVLYEMLTGQRAFARDTASDTLAAILRDEPADPGAASRPIPPALRRVIDHCLEKAPGRRFRDAQDLAFALESTAGSGTGSDLPAVPAPRRLRAAGLAAALLLAAGAGLVLGRYAWSRPASLPVFTSLTVDSEIIESARFTRRGEGVLFTASPEDRTTKTIRSLDLGSPVIHAFQGPDAWLLAVGPRDELAVLSGMKRNLRLDQPIGSLGRCPPGRALPQLVDQEILDATFGPDGNLALVRVAGGGEERAFRCRLEYPKGHVLLEQQDGWLKDLRFSPDGRTLAFNRHPVNIDDLGTVSVLDLATGVVRNLSPTYASLEGLAWTPDGREIWYSATEGGVARDLWAVDLKGRVRHVFAAPIGLCLLDIGPDGRLLASIDDRRLQVVFTRPGQAAPRRLSLGTWSHPLALSADGQLAVADDESTSQGPDYPIYLLPTDGSTPTSLGNGFGAAFAPGGRRLCVWRPLGGTWSPVVISLDGGEEILPVGDLETFPNKPFAWNTQGEVLTYARSKAGLWRIWRLLPAGPQPLPWEAPDDVLDFTAPDAEGHLLYVHRARQPWVQVDLRHPELPPRPVPGTLPGDALLGVAADRTALFVAPPVADAAFRVDLRTGRREALPVPKGTGLLQAVSADGKGFFAKNYPATSRLLLVEGLH